MNCTVWRCGMFFLACLHIPVEKKWSKDKLVCTAGSIYFSRIWEVFCQVSGLMTMFVGFWLAFSFWLLWFVWPQSLIFFSLNIYIFYWTNPRRIDSQTGAAVWRTASLLATENGQTAEPQGSHDHTHHVVRQEEDEAGILVQHPQRQVSKRLMIY